ncbi:MAG: class I SAM-dependent methyltransferase [Deltaproteobacteria bacterium]|nr:class I SAM-dependent methyltransferase [Deltaproteobacteria bacterium]
MSPRGFDSFAPLYDLGVSIIAFFFGGEEGLRQTVIDALAPVNGRRVLDVFAGTGAIALKASGAGAEVVVLDLSQGMLRVAKEKSRSSAVPIGIVAADAAFMPFADSAFDAVVASMGLHETASAEGTAVINESYRVLRPGGRFVIFDYHKADGFAGFLQGLFFAFAEGDSAREWARSDVQQRLSSAGFKGFKRKFLLKRALQVITVER